MKKILNGWFAVALLVLVGCAASPPVVGVWNVEMNTPLGLARNLDSNGRYRYDGFDCWVKRLLTASCMTVIQSLSQKSMLRVRLVLDFSGT